MCLYPSRNEKKVVSAFNAAGPTEQQIFRKLLHKYNRLELEIRGPAFVRNLTPFIENLTDLIDEMKYVFGQCGISVSS